jgi:hypothetical protein
MSVCAVVDSGTGAVTATSTPVASCSTLVLLSSDEYAYAVSGSAWALSLSDGVDIGVAILGVWALGFCFRAIASVLQSTDEREES